jgi:hypothetical protein
MKILDIFKTRRRLVAERDMAWNKLDQLRDMALVAESPSRFREWLRKDMDEDPPRVMPGSDLGEGRLIIKHWAVSIVAASMIDVVTEHGGENYLIMNLMAPDGRQVEVTLRKEGGLAPHEKAKQLEKENKELRKQLDAYLSSQENR